MIRTGSADKNLLLFFLVAALVFKVFTFFYSVIDIDESTYLLIGKELFKGKILYVDYYDTKPIGIFLIFGLLETITGQGILFSRLLAALIIGLTSFYLYRLKLIITGNRYVSIFAGIIYLILASMYRFTYAANTELFFIFFTILSFNILFKGERDFRFFAGGLIAGFGFIIKYMVAFDMLAYALFLLFLVFKQRMRFLKLMKAGILLFTGFIIPVGMVILFYTIIGHLEEFQSFSFSFLMKYQQATGMQEYWKMVIDVHVKYLPAFILFYYFLYRNFLRIPKQSYSFFVIIWTVMTYIAVLSLKKPNTHYVIQVFPVMAFVIADIFAIPNRSGDFIKKHAAQFLSWTVGILLIISLINQLYYVFKNDHPRQIARYLEERMDKDGIIYVSGYKHIIYYLLEQPPPTPYVHPTMFVYADHINKLDIDLDREIGLVLDQKPQFIVYRIDSYMYGHEAYFLRNYEKSAEFDNNIYVYKRKDTVNIQ